MLWALNAVLTCPLVKRLLLSTRWSPCGITDVHILLFLNHSVSSRYAPFASPRLCAVSKTKPVQNPQLFIKTMMSFLFATDVELGYDPTITRLQDNRLVFTMTDEQGSLIYYRTVRGLSDYRSCNITGRMTRVWEVEKVSEPNETGKVLSRGVLKNVWLDESAPTERQVQEAIFKAIEARSSTFKTNKVAQKLGPTIRKDLKNTLKKERYKKFFLTILADWQGELSKIVSPVAWRRHDLLLAEVVPETEGAQPLHSGVSVDRVTSNVPQETRLEQERTAWKKVQERDFHPKRQYRVVFQELCVTVGHLPTLGEVMNVLNQTLGGKSSAFLSFSSVVSLPILSQLSDCFTSLVGYTEI